MSVLVDRRRSMYTTSGSLLLRLRNPNEREAWDRFADLYTPLLYYWLRRLGLTGDDAADLVQEVFVVLVAKLPNFEYHRDGTFRGWLRTLTINKYRESRRRKKLPMADQLVDVPARDSRGDLEESEYRRHLVEQMLHILKEEFPPSTWLYFHEYVVAGCDPKAVAARFGVSIGTVYTAKSKVLSRLREELAGLLD
jgi:RNA polymerase sigma-70 factor, ECF subfamily